MLGDTLAWKFQKVLYTPLYFVNGFEYKIESIINSKISERNKNKTFKICNLEQLSLF